MPRKHDQRKCEYCDYEYLGFHDRTQHLEVDNRYTRKDNQSEKLRRVLFFNTVDGPELLSKMTTDLLEEKLETDSKSLGNALTNDRYVDRCGTASNGNAEWRHKIWIDSEPA
jgi:hypothetical protein